MYLAFHQLVCAQKYNERCYRRHTHSLGELPDGRPGVEDTAVKNILIEKLYDALNSSQKRNTPSSLSCFLMEEVNGVWRRMGHDIL
jgi:hypothetical protein